MTRGSPNVILLRHDVMKRPHIEERNPANSLSRSNGRYVTMLSASWRAIASYGRRVGPALSRIARSGKRGILSHMYSAITGWGMSVPSRILTNADLERIVDTSDEWIVSRTGIRERHI